MQDCNDVLSMKLEYHTKDGMVVKDDSKDELIDHWRMIMEKYLQKGMKSSLLNCHFGEELIMVIKKHSMFEHPQPCRLNMQLGDMHYWLHEFSFDEYPQGVENRKRCGDKEMVAAIQNLCENLKQPICSNGMQQQRTRLDIELDEL